MRQIRFHLLDLAAAQLSVATVKRHQLHTQAITGTVLPFPTSLPLRFVRIERYVIPKKSLTGDSAERVDTRVLQITYELDRASAPLYVGQQVDVFINRPSEPTAPTEDTGPERR